MKFTEETIQQLQGIAIELTMLTGEIVSAIHNDDYYYAELHFSAGVIDAEAGDKKRFYFHAARPAWMTKSLHIQNGSKISASAERSPEAIARDIMNRLMPDALDYWKRCEKAQENYEADTKKINEYLEILAPYGMKPLNWQGSDHHKSLTHPHARAQLYTSGVHDVRLNDVSIDKLIQILEILGE